MVSKAESEMLVNWIENSWEPKDWHWVSIKILFNSTEKAQGVFWVFKKPILFGIGPVYKVSTKLELSPRNYKEEPTAELDSTTEICEDESPAKGPSIATKLPS